MRLRLFIISVVAVLLSSCGEYHKLLKSNDFALIYTKAIDYYNSGDYKKAQTLFETVRTVYVGTTKSQTIAYYRAFCYYNQKDYENAAELFRQFLSQFPDSPYYEECLYMVGFSDYKASPRVRLDQTVSDKALSEFNLFLKRYPTSSKCEQIYVYIEELKDKLSYKAYLSASNYYLREHYKAAVISLENCLKDYPNSKYREDVMKMLFDSKFNLAVNSIEDKQLDRYNSALEEYYYFVEEYPNSKSVPEMRKKYEIISKYIKGFDDKMKVE